MKKYKEKQGKNMEHKDITKQKHKNQKENKKTQGKKNKPRWTRRNKTQKISQLIVWSRKTESPVFALLLVVLLLCLVSQTLFGLYSYIPEQVKNCL